MKKPYPAKQDTAFSLRQLGRDGREREPEVAPLPDLALVAQEPTGEDPVEYRGYVPPRSIVIPGTYPRKFAAGVYGVPCAMIIGRRKESTDKKTSLNAALRDYGIQA